MIEVTGILRRYLYVKLPYVIGILDTDDGKVSFTGYTLNPPPIDVELTLKGVTEIHPKYGNQLKFQEIIVNIPEATNLYGLRKLISGLPHMNWEASAKLVNQLGYPFPISTAWCDITGISVYQLEEIKDTFEKLTNPHPLTDFIYSLGIPLAWQPYILQHIPRSDIELFRIDPYMILEIPGIPFRDLDPLLLKHDIRLRGSTRRKKLLAITTIQEYMDNTGSTYVPFDKITEIVPSDQTWTTWEPILKQQIEQKTLHIVNDLGLTTARWLTTETLIQHYLSSIRNYEISFSNAEWVKKDKPTSEQLSILEAISKNTISILTGGPGTGKTFTIRGIVTSMPKHMKVMLLAPTGKAAKRLSETLNGIAHTMPMTIHSFLGLQPEDELFSNRLTLAPKSDIYDLIIVDEASMLDSRIFLYLLSALNGATKLVLVGDVDQLPAVNPGSCLCDLIKSKKYPTIKLTANLRQGGLHAIHKAAYGILKSKVPSLEDASGWKVFISEYPDKLRERLCQSVVDYIKTHKTIDLIQDIQIITPTRHGKLGTKLLNEELSSLLNPDIGQSTCERWGKPWLRSGDKIRLIKNAILENTVGKPILVVNGDVGMVLEISVHKELARIKIKLDRDTIWVKGRLDTLSPDNPINYIELSWATTVHKCQGSEYNAVWLALGQDAHSELLTRSMIYTGITRAKEDLYLFSNLATVTKCTHNNPSHLRTTLLSHLLTEK